jgi:hypothetical protein
VVSYLSFLHQMFVDMRSQSRIIETVELFLTAIDSSRMLHIACIIALAGFAIIKSVLYYVATQLVNS